MKSKKSVCFMICLLTALFLSSCEKEQNQSRLVYSSALIESEAVSSTPVSEASDISSKEFSSTLTADFVLTFTQSEANETKEIARYPEYSVLTFGGDVNLTLQDGTAYPLKEAFEKGVITPEKILETAKRDAELGKIRSEIFKDGGSREYYYDGYTILKLKTLGGEKDLVIGKSGSIITQYHKK